MEDLNKIYQTVREYYQNLSSNYASPRWLTYANYQLSVIPSSQKGNIPTPKEVKIVNLDIVSDELSCLQTEYKNSQGYCRDVLGMICTHNTWRIVCGMTAHTEYRFENLYSEQGKEKLDEEKKIRDVLTCYCHDVYLMNADDCLSLFCEESRMYHPNTDGSFTDVDIQILRQRWRDMPNPIALGFSEFSRIYYIEILDSNTAVTKIGCAKLDQYFNDYLWLMKLNDKWKIVNKMTQCLHVGERA